MKGCGRLSHPSPLQILQKSFCLHYVYDADDSSIKCSILNVHYNTGEKCDGSFDPILDKCTHSYCKFNKPVGKKGKYPITEESTSTICPTLFPTKYHNT